ncbi:MAG: Type 1 glutamine amidotransferase-like domain-containing protein [Saccharofermentans sp.]|nr:Type 1 glutamine amidotransferase-like domain-containing protein [Saccharofermentans sp.]
MNLFLTSNPLKKDGSINDANDFLWNFKYSLSYENNALFIASDPTYRVATLRFADQLKNAINSAGVFVKSMDVLDNENADMSKEEIQRHNLIILAGGHVPTQNSFFNEIDLKSKLEGYNGTVLGISAGSMNAAQEVYAIPEVEGETADSFVKFLPGLGLTNVQIVPHYDETMASVVDGKKIDNLVLFDSRDKKFLGLPDGSYLNSADGHELVYGPFYTIANGISTRTEAGFMAKSFD